MIGIDLKLTVMAAADINVGVVAKWCIISMGCLVSILALNVAPVLGQDNGTLNGTVSFLENYDSQSDAQHFRILNNGEQVQLVLDEYAGTSQSMPSYLYEPSLFKSCPKSMSNIILSSLSMRTSCLCHSWGLNMMLVCQAYTTNSNYMNSCNMNGSN